MATMRPLIAFIPLVGALAFTGLVMCWGSCPNADSDRAAAAETTLTPPADPDADLREAAVRAAHRCNGAKLEKAPGAASSASVAADSQRNRHPQRRGWHRFIALLVGWYSIGFAVMPWVAPNLRPPRR